MSKLFFLTIIGLVGLVSCSQEKKNQSHQEIKKPNIIYILADDLGYGELGCYGQTIISTPHLDKLASKGMKFTQHYSGGAVCAPARSSLMTGYHTGHTPIRGNKELGEEGQVPLPDETITLAEVLKKAGYKTGMFGKWGLGFGEGDPNNQGFDEFFGYNCQRLAHRYYPPYLNHNQKQVSLKGNDWTNTVTYAPDVIQDETLKFLEQNKDTPFFVYVPLVLPHAEIISPNDSIYNLYKGKFKETPFTVDNKYTSDYGPDIVKKEYTSQDDPLATYATMVTRMDYYIGQIVAKVEELGISENTIIMFASDNGPYIEGGGNPSFFNSTAGLKGVKRDLYEGGIRSPFIVAWPGKIKENSITDHISAFWDMMPTLSELAGVETPIQTDGISMVPTFIGEGKQKQHDYLYWEYSIRKGRKALRKGDWKAVWYKINKKGSSTFELFNLAKDVNEQNDLSALFPERVKEMKQLMKEASTPSQLFPFK
ncbi:arylsulfatase [Aquimarina aggregata]|uniref:arylsulfatase n=1 Tax=Aquimarina aggregata TaxID=1642818 RepID=UPI002490D289|nr:arylsulfatase [Aquimarina aggregata]